MIEMTSEEFRALGYQAVDMIAERMGALRDLPTRQLLPPDLRTRLMHSPLADAPTDAAVLLQRMANEVFPYPMGNSSPHFYAWINSTAAPMGILAELLAAGHNASVAGGDHSAVYIEHGVLNWVKEWFGFPHQAGGICVSGGSMANVIGLAVMRHVKTQGMMRATGFADQPRMIIYTSTQGHSCIQKAIELLGFGNDQLRRIPVDSEYRLRVDLLQEAIRADRAAGYLPVCVAASAGTVNTGALDPFAALADVCAAEDLWFHVDGAYGGVGILASEVAPLFAGIDRADSIAVDPHKWLYMPIECGLALVRDESAMRQTFSVIPPYLQDDRALPWFSEYGIQQTRGFRALKLWLTLQQVGLAGYRDLIASDIRSTRSLCAKIAARADFALVAAGPLSICTFVYAPAEATDVDALNRALALRVQSEGQAFITTTVLDDRVVLRACIVNFRTTDADLDYLLDVIQVAGQAVLADSIALPA